MVRDWKESLSVSEETKVMVPRDISDLRLARELKTPWTQLCSLRESVSVGTILGVNYTSHEWKGDSLLPAKPGCETDSKNLEIDFIYEYHF